MQDEGLIRDIGLCNVRAEEIERAADLAEISAVQTALSPPDLTSVKNGVAELCIERGIQLIAHSPFGGPKAARRLANEPTLRTIATRRNA